MPILVISYAAIMLLLFSSYYLYKKKGNQLYLMMSFLGIVMLILLSLTAFLFFEF